MTPIRLLLATGLVAAAAVGGLYGSGFILDSVMAEGAAPGGEERSERAARVETVVAERGPIRRVVEAIGSTEAVQSIDVQPMADGRVVAVSFEEGAEVKAGQPLVQLDDRAERAALKEAEASLEEASSNLERARTLARQNIQSNATLEATEALVLRAEAVREQALNAVEDRRAVAAFAGTVGLSDVDVGQMVTTATVLTSLDDLSRIDVTFSLPEVYFAEVKPGQTVVAASDAYGERRFEGTVTAIGTRIDPASRSFAVRATIPNEDRALATGMFVGVSIVLEERQSVTVPEVAVVNEGDKTYLFTVGDGAASRRDVTIGLRQAGRVEIREGLDEGTPVVVSGIQAVGEGGKVEIVDDGDPADAGAEPGTAPPAAPKPMPSAAAAKGQVG